MPSATTNSTIASITSRLSAVDVDLLIIPWFEDDGPDAVPEVDAAVDGEIGRALRSTEFAAKPFDLFVTPITDRNWRARRVALVGAGPSAEYDGDLARKLANEPGNALTPREFAARAAAIAAEGGVNVEVLDESDIASLGMGLLLGVARGSSEPPRLIVFRYEPSGTAAGPVLGLVGKG